MLQARTVGLFVPGDRPERFAKAAASGASFVILDLEDAVALPRKVEARAAVRAALRGDLHGFVRINPPSTGEGQADLDMLRERPPDGVMIAKARSAADVHAVGAALPGVALVALVESIDGMLALDAIARTAGIEALAFGAFDLCAELGARATPDVLAPWRSRIVFAARSAGIDAIDTPFLGLDDEPGSYADAVRSVDFGFDGKLAVHPTQIAPIRRAFVPLPEELERARGIAAANAAGGVKVYDGAMIDRPVLLAAQRVIARAEEP